MTPLSRGVSVSYCCDNAAKQATPKFTGYKNNHLFSCLCFCLQVLGLVSGFCGLSQIYSPFLYILLETSAIRGILFSWQMMRTRDAKPNYATCFCSYCIMAVYILWPKLVRWPSPKSMEQENILCSRGIGKWLNICWIIFQSSSKGLVRTSTYELGERGNNSLFSGRRCKVTWQSMESQGGGENWGHFCHHLPYVATPD